MKDEDEPRDLLGEMVIQARLMITGGEASEIDRMGRADRYLIARAILDAARAARADGKPHPRSEDVANALIAMRTDAELGAARRPAPRRWARPCWSSAPACAGASSTAMVPSGPTRT